MSDAASPAKAPAPAPPQLPEPIARFLSANWLADNAEFCGIACALFGFLLCGAAMMLGIDSVNFTGVFRAPELQNAPIDLGNVAHKEVGYLWAINWSLFGVVVMPLIILFGLLTYREIEPTIERIGQRGMIRDVQTLEPIPAATLLEQWRRGEIAWRILFIIVFVFGALFIAFDGWKVVSDPILNPAVLRGIRLDDPAYEFDWSISCLFEGSRTTCGPLMAFATLGYALVPGLSTVSAFIVVMVALRFMAFIASAGNRRHAWLVFVDISDSKHSRFGWTTFEGFFSNLLYFAIVVLFGLWLMVVQNSYLRDPNSESVVQMIFAELEGHHQHH